MKQIIQESQGIPEEEEEEHKELDLKKQNDLFTREAEELHRELEKILDYTGEDHGRIVEHFGSSRYGRRR